MRLSVLALLLLTTPIAAQPKQLPPDLVAPTDALSPADERKAFTVPAGFDVQLVASEPDIQKPMQMAWDAKGRLWVTTSHHYPFPAPQGKGTDKLFVLSDFDPATGKAKKVQVFASDLNIPIGVLPLPDGKSVIVSSTGEIRKYTDTDDDGKADKSEVLFGGFGFRDTHGMTNSFTLMPDGWVYACHGFNNDSKVKGTDGHEVTMNSGNTFRFRPDGSRIEVYTRGQVNPFGIAVDPWFNLYTADCHSKPITQLIPGAYYDSFGKPHDGLGYGPHVTRHDHGSTGLCGLAWYDADHFPKDYLGCMFVGNVVTNRINFDRIEWKGSSPVAKELPDFLTSTDRWFRPVDIKLGPDGALYVADFYNKVIGHYEVDLRHPGRDKDRGRIWRIVWKGTDGKAAVAKPAYSDLTTTAEAELVKLMESPNLAVRLSAANQIATRGEKGVNALPKGLLPAPQVEVSRVLAPPLTLVERAGLMKDEGYQKLSSLILMVQEASGGPELAVGMARALASRGDWGDGARSAAKGLLQLKSPQVQRAAAEAITFHPHVDFVKPLVELLKATPAEDTHLRHAARIALRNCLRDDEKAWPKDKEYDSTIAEVALAIPNQKAADYLLWHISWESIKGDKLAPAAEHVARYGGDPGERLIKALTQAWSSDPKAGDAVLATVRGLAAAGRHLDASQAAAVLRAAENEIGACGEPDSIPTADQTKRMLAAARVLLAVPGVVQESAALKPRGHGVGRLAILLSLPEAPPDLRVVAAQVAMRYDPTTGLRRGHGALRDPAIPEAVRTGILLAFAASSNKEARLDARDALKDAPYRTALAVGTALAGSPAGADDLLTAVKTGKAPARLLQEKAVLERLRAANVPDLDKQVAALTKGLPALDQRLAELVKTRAKAFTSVKADKELGAKVFTKNCAACHRIGDQGGKVAPQLDGIGVRGLERLLEDTLDPNRNVDQAFRARIVTTKDEKTVTGLMLRVEGEVLVLADAEGKEVRIPTKDIDTNRETMLSPMPANFGEVIPEADFAHLVAYLLDQKAAKKE